MVQSKKMINIMKSLALILMLLMVLGAKRKDSGLISFHLESGQESKKEESIQIRVSNKIFSVLKKPSFNQRDIDGFYPFLSEDGESYGISFKLKKKKAEELSTLSTVARGRRLVTVLGMEPVDFVVIDGPIQHGHITCWKGFTEKSIGKFESLGLNLIEPKGPTSTIAPPEPLPQQIDSE